MVKAKDIDSVLAGDSGVKRIKLGLAGNPNSGKTTVFNELTGAHQKVGNWPGVTVEVKTGISKFGGYTFEITDLPGTYSLSARSTEERIARDYILDHRPDIIIQVVEGPNLERNLYLTTQLIDLEVPVVIAFNMFDEVIDRKIKVDLDKLGELLGTPIVPTIGKKGYGVKELLNAAIRIVEKENGLAAKPVRIDYSHEIEKHIAELEKTILLTGDLKKRYPVRWLALGLLEGDEYVAQRVREASALHEKLLYDSVKIREHLASIFKDDPGELITDRRYGFISGALKESAAFPDKGEISSTDRLDSVFTNRIIGIPVLLLMMWLLFQITFGLGAYPMGWIEIGVEYAGKFINAVLPESDVKDLLIDGIIGGVGSVIIFLPNILILFLGISFLEDSGYMARAAFVTDRIMHALGLHGKSFIPLLMGFGCAVPAVIATRMLESRRDRIITMLVIPLMSCSAKLPVYILIAGTFFPTQAGNMIFLLYIIGILMSLIAARVLGSILFKGESSSFVMELPPYRLPTARSVLFHMWHRAGMFLRKMGGVILVGSIVLWFLGAYPKLESEPESISVERESLEMSYNKLMSDSGSVKNMDQFKEEHEKKLQHIDEQLRAVELKNTFIGRIGRFIHPVFQPLGFSWQMGVSLLTGFVAKEVVVSSLGVLYATGENGAAHLQRALKHAGITPLAAFAFLVFTLLYTPCIATVTAILRESRSHKFMLVSIFYQTMLAWLAAFVVYQGGKLMGLD